MGRERRCIAPVGCAGINILGGARGEHSLSSSPPLPLPSPTGLSFRQAAFQRSIVDHAMQFPSAQWISYSTCSVNRVR